MWLPMEDHTTILLLTTVTPSTTIYVCRLAQCTNVTDRHTDHGTVISTPIGEIASKLASYSYIKTRSQAVARIVDRTASQHLWGHVTSSVTWPFDSPYAISYWWSFGTKPLFLRVSAIFNVECNAMVGMTLIRPINKGQGHPFWHQSISHIRLPISCHSKFCSRTHRLATMHFVLTDRQTSETTYATL